MTPSAKIAIVAALERELHPLIKQWRSTTIAHDDQQFKVYEANYAVAICGGIGPESARRAAEAVIAKYSPEVLISAGVAGALVPELHVGEVIFPEVIVNTQDGSRHQTAIPESPIKNSPLARTVLASYPQIATPEQKKQLAKSYGAHAVDMESAAVALAAEKHHLPLVAIKAISDEADFELPAMAEFIRNGQFQTAPFLVHIALRPWLWLQVYRLARNTRTASENLCAWLRESVLTNTIVPDTSKPNS